MADHTYIKVWDPLVRIFHWGLVGAFAIAYLSEDELLDLHVIAGYTVLVLVIFRLFWGVVGTRHARFGNFVRRPSLVLTYLKEAARFRGERYVGHNPAAGAMIVALLVSLLLLSLSGLALYGAAEYSGPFAAWFGGNRGFWAEFLEEAHEFLADFTLALVVLHVIGVLLASFQHRENLAWSMFTGLKRREIP